MGVTNWFLIDWVTSFPFRYTPSSCWVWLSSPDPPAAVDQARPPGRNRAPSYGCGSAPRGAAGAPVPASSPVGFGPEEAPVVGAPRRRNTAPASGKPAGGRWRGEIEFLIWKCRKSSKCMRAQCRNFLRRLTKCQRVQGVSRKGVKDMTVEATPAASCPFIIRFCSCRKSITRLQTFSLTASVKTNVDSPGTAMLCRSLSECS